MVALELADSRHKQIGRFASKLHQSQAHAHMSNTNKVKESKGGGKADMQCGSSNKKAGRFNYSLAISKFNLRVH